MPAFPPEVLRATAWGLVATVLLAILIALGSRNLAYFDAALVAYTFAILFSTFGLTYRYAMWLQRPPTAQFWRRGWQAFCARGWRWRNAGVWLRRVGSEVLLNRFIFRRDLMRGAAHLLVMWGCILAVLITFPLVFGWLWFRPVDGDLSRYETMIFGFPTFRFAHGTGLGTFIFHGLVWSALLVIPGVMLAMRRRMRERGAAAVQRLVEDFTPLLLLFVVSLTGLMLTASYTWMRGYAYSFIAILHAVTVIATFVWLPFGKFFHIFQRPAQLGVGFHQDLGRSVEPARCRRCGHGFTSVMHVEDLVEVQRKLGFAWEIPGSPVEHFQWVCPPCRRASFAMAQAKLWGGRRGGRPLEVGALPMPVHVNPGEGQGPLGADDARNFHP